ncbi:MAG: hypothetical protein AB1758_30975 [Candidatus Eremiobacterota bacterium]
MVHLLERGADLRAVQELGHLYTQLELSDLRRVLLLRCHPRERR